MDPAQVDPAQVDRAEPADRTDRAGPAEPHLVDRRPADLAEPHLVDRRPADPVGARRVVRAELTRPADQAHPHLADRRPAAPRLPDPVDLMAMDLAARVDLRLANLVVRAGLDPADTVRVGLVGLAVPADTDRAGLVGPVSLDLAARVDRADPAGRMDLTGLATLVGVMVRRRLPMYSAVSTIGVARNSAVRETRRTASAHPTTVLRHHPRSAGSVGTTGHLPGILRRTGTGRPLPAVGTVRRLPAVGTRRGTAPDAI